MDRFGVFGHNWVKHWVTGPANYCSVAAALVPPRRETVVHVQILIVATPLIKVSTWIYPVEFAVMHYTRTASRFASKPGPLLAPSFIRLGSTPVSGDHREGQVLAVLPLDRGDKSLSTPEDSLLVGKLGTSLSRLCHTLPCRSSLIGLALWSAQPTSVTARGVSNLSQGWDGGGEREREEERREKRGDVGK